MIPAIICGTTITSPARLVFRRLSALAPLRPVLPPLRPTRALVRRCLSGPAHLGPFAEYVQGQAPAPNVREYFYYIDHQGMVSNGRVLAKGSSLSTSSPA